MESFTDLSRLGVDPDLAQRLDEDFCFDHEVVLLGPPPESMKAVVPLGMLDPSQERIIDQVQRRIGWQVRPVQLNAYEMDQALRSGFGSAEEEEDCPLLEEEAPCKPLPERLALVNQHRISFARGDTTPEIVAGIFAHAVRSRATDIHLEAFPDDIDLRFRIDGVLRQIPSPLSPENVREIVSYIKVLAGLDIAQKRIPQDGRIALTYHDERGLSRRVDLRGAILPGLHGENVVLRVLDSARTEISMAQLGMPRAIYQGMDECLRAPGGLLLVTGPTASGKTTSLYAALHHINSDENKILTVEDPIEYEIPRINQHQVSRTLSFADYARAFMRQNPDILMIGEIRDAETARLVLRAAQMGHLVLSTLHTRSAVAAVPRLKSFGVDQTLLASGLLGSLSQRLVRKVCPECSRPARPGPDLLKRVGIFPAERDAPSAVGCAACGGTGYFGQTGVFELFLVDELCRRTIRTGEELQAVLPESYAPMVHDAVSKALAGITTIEEIVRHVPLPVSPQRQGACLTGGAPAQLAS